jgi:dolichol-phosphate mannosyltransferase
MKMNKTLISIVVPCYNEVLNIKPFIQEFVKNLTDRSEKYEIIFVDDGSIDLTWQEIKYASKNNTHDLLVFDSIKFSKNFGKESALYAGICHAQGEAIITIDADLQHPVNKIFEMVDIWKTKDYSIVNAIKEKRQKEGFFKKSITVFYYFLFKLITGMNIVNQTDFKLLDRVVANHYINLPEHNRFYRGLIMWIGFSSTSLLFTPQERENSASKWPIKNLVSYARQSIISFSFIPLKFITWIGLFSIIFSIVLTLDTLWKNIFGAPAEGFSTVILLQLGIGSLILFSLGIIGEYLAEIYIELKKRPQSIIAENYKSKK